MLWRSSGVRETVQWPSMSFSSSETDARLREIDQLLANAGVERKRGPRKRALRPPEKNSPKPRSRKGKIEVLRLPGWALNKSRGAGRESGWLVHGFSTRTGGLTEVYRAGSQTGGRNGDLNLGFTTHDSHETVVANRKLFLQAVWGARELPGLVTLRQIHSGLTRRVTAGDAGEPGETALFQADGLMTSEPGILLSIQTADCIPILVADRKRRAVAAFHAGWRGTLARIVEGGIGRMRLEFGSQPEDLIAAIGPGIGACCYAVGEEVRFEFESQFSYAPELFREVYDSDPVKEKYPLLFLTARAPGHSNIGPQLHLDLVEANRRQLLASGLAPEAIAIAGECTHCQTARFFSYRGEQGFTGRMMSVVGIRP
jgi:hypothetical protein